METPNDKGYHKLEIFKRSKELAIKVHAMSLTLPKFEILSKQIFRFIQSVGHEHERPFYVREPEITNDAQASVSPIQQSPITELNAHAESPIVRLSAHDEVSNPESDLFLRACQRQPVNRTPVWMMRQAGRYLPEYRAVRAKTDFLTLCKTPELAAEVSLQPVEILDVDAAIIFSDILLLPEAMGMQLVVDEGKGGPRFTVPVRTVHDIAKLIIPDPEEKLKFVLDALRLVRKQLHESVPLIGFSGSPWTLAAYMVDGQSSNDFRYVKELIRDCPALVHELLKKLAKAAAVFLSAQITAGAQALQIFDTWGGLLPHDAFREFSLRYIKQIIAETTTNGAPIIVFCKDCGQSLEEIASTGCKVVGLDSATDIGDARRLIGDRVALQGNVDPAILKTSAARIREEVRSVLEKFGKGPGHIFNLGHGILPDTPVEHTKEFIRAVKEESIHFH